MSAVRLAQDCIHMANAAMQNRGFLQDAENKTEYSIDFKGMSQELEMPQAVVDLVKMQQHEHNETPASAFKHDRKY